MKHFTPINVVLVALLARILFLPTWPLAVALVTALLVYAFEQHEFNRAIRDATSLSETQALSAKVDDLAKLQAGVTLQAAETKKQQEEIKKVLSSSMLVNAFKPPARRTQTHVAG